MRARPNRIGTLDHIAPHRSQRWPRGWPPPAEERPEIVPAGIGLRNDWPVATMGSCFASEVRRWLWGHGYSVLGLKDQDGNGAIEYPPRPFYNPASIRQEVERAFGTFEPAERVWRTVAKGKRVWLDPYRHNATFESRKTMEDELKTYAADLRRMLLGSKLVVLTLGLAEYWHSRKDFAAFSAVPPADVFDPALHAAALMSGGEAENHLHRTVSLLLRPPGPDHIILTVSPVPLLATFRSVAVQEADRESKRILKRAAKAVTAGYGGQVHYFPSFELVRSLGRRAWKPDGRHVSAWGVAQVMQAFERWAA